MNKVYKSITHEEKFFHLKPKDLEDIYEHVCSSFPWRGATFFYRLENNGWYMSAAFCAWDDQFNRKVGRNIARRRYFNGWRKAHGEQEPVWDDALTFFEDICLGGNVDNQENSLSEM